jgi:anti-sigma factor RsiW
MSWLRHRRIRQAVSAYVDGELDPVTATAVSAHLRRCWACSGEAELIRMIKRSLHSFASRRRDELAVMRLQRRLRGPGSAPG